MADAAPAGPSIARRVAACGATLIEYASVGPWPLGVAFEDDPVRFDEVRNGVPIAKDILSVARELKPDALVVDCMMGAGLVASEVLDIPTAVLVHVLYQPFVSFWGNIAVEVSRCREAFGLEPLGSPALADQLGRAAKVLALMPEEFDYPDAPRSDNTHYVGPIFDPPVPNPPDDLGFDPGDHRPLVLVSLSTTKQRQGEALPPILAALESLPVRGLVTLGGIDAGHHSIPSNVVVHDYLPHAGVLGQVSLVVSHGGLSTVMAALAHGVPLVCIPQGREQPLNAERVAACGAGVNLPIDTGAEAVADAIATVLDEPRYKVAAEAMAALIHDQGGGASALRHIEALVGGATAATKRDSGRDRAGPSLIGLTHPAKRG
jgi:MGT family glycosyltransferase